MVSRRHKRHYLLILLSAAVLPMAAQALNDADVASAAPNTARHLRAITQLLASNRLHGRDNKTPESALAQHVLIRLLQRYGAGLSSGSADDAYQQPFTLNGNSGTNLLAVIRGRELPDEYVAVGAHYDHLGTRSNADGHCFALGTPGGNICNGATDNAAGVATVLGIAEAIHSLPEPPRRSVILALWDSEEDGLVGSRYYVSHALVPLQQTVAYVNFDILGQDLLPSLKTTTFAVGSETGGAGLQQLVGDAAAGEALTVHRVSYLFGQERSDYKNFVDHKVPTVFFSDATGACYHTTGDDLSIVNFTKMRAQARIAFRVVMNLAERSDRLPFAGRGSSPAVYTDAAAISQVLEAARADNQLFSADDNQLIAQVRDRTAAAVAAGPAAFDNTDILTLLGDTIAVVNALTRIECRRF